MAEITIVDTSPRDGPVGVSKIKTDGKVALANSLMECGITKIDCVAFTHPRIRPEYSDAEKVISTIDKRPGVSIIGLAPNEIACRRALSTNIDEIGILISVSEAFNKSVLGTGVNKTLYKTVPAIIQLCKEKSKKIRAYLLSSFFCQFEGKIPVTNIVALTSKLSFLGVNEISLVDTAGMANPRQVKETVKALLDLQLPTHFAVHFHDTHGMGLANCLAAFESGIHIFDTAIGGLSGTPYGAPNMEVGSWNVPTEDLVYMFDQMGIDTGINMDAVRESAKLAQTISGRDLAGHLMKANTAFLLENFPTALALSKV
jgi:hydroxymethylglutaryl-CoA lyase